jgi:tRNA A-37 threonylcarbamoyl transferase component Bud32/predicted nucleotidyltransferase
MSSISHQELKIIKNCITRIAKNHKVAAVCLYGSKVAGYARANSDFDIIIVLENYGYIIKYVYLKEDGIEVSALVVDRKSFEKDAEFAFLGDFVVGRLLHTYEPIQNPELFSGLEKSYKKRVLLEEIFNIVRDTNIFSTEILFPLEYVMFSKIKHRSTLYPNAIYSYYKMYCGENSVSNKEFALDGYQRALKEIMDEDKELLIIRPSDSLLQISEKRVLVQKKRKIASLKLTKKLQEFGSYFVHAYAGRHALHHAVREAESKINRHKKFSIELPKFMSCPKESYWKIPEGVLIFDNKNWLKIMAESKGFSKYFISNKCRLGNLNSRTISYTLTDSDDKTRNKVIIVVKEFAKTKGVKWGRLGAWTTPVRQLSIGDPLFRLGNEYKALRYIRSLGLNTPIIESVVLDRKILITEFIEGKTIGDIIKECLRRNSIDGLEWIRVAGEQIAKIHADKSTLGNVKPMNIIINRNSLYFTGVEQFGFKSGDPILDIVQFISRGLKRTGNTAMASQITKEFLRGYSKDRTIEHVKKLAKSKHYVESFYPVFAPAIGRMIKKEITTFAG